MNSSFWHTSEEKPVDNKMVMFFAGGGHFPYVNFYNKKTDYFGDWKSVCVSKWAYVDDVINLAEETIKLREKYSKAIKGE